MTEYVYDSILERWEHPETGVIILAEDMPWELKPESHDD